MLGWLLAATACTDRGLDDSVDADSAASSFNCPGGSEAPAAAPESWTLLPPAPAGDILDFATTAADPSRVYAVSSINGVYRSDDGGQTWLGLDSDITHVQAQALAHSADPDLVFHSSGPLYRSTNGGHRWESTGAGTMEEVGYARGLAQVDDALLMLDGSGRLFRSEDDGASWTSWSALPDPRHSESYQVDEDHAFLASEGPVVLALREGSGVWRSADGGASWATVTEDATRVNTLGMDDGEAWFAAPSGIWWSTDTGETWQIIDPQGQDFVAATRQLAGGILFFTTGTVWRLDQGELATWSVPDLDLGELRTAARADTHLLLGAERGIALSADEGVTWTPAAEGPTDDDTAVLTAHSKCPGWLFVGTQCESGGYVSTSGGAELTQAETYMHYVMVARESPHDPAELWVTTDDRVYRTPDLGGAWTIAVPDSMAVHFHGLDLDPWNDGVVLVGSVGSGLFADDRPRVYRTDDDGQRWQDSSDGLPDGDWSAHALHFSRTLEEVVLLGTYKGGDIRHDGSPGVGLYRSTDGGRTWAESGPGGVQDVAQFAECDGRLYAAVDTGIAVSDDAGDSWVLIRSGFEPYVAIACHGDTVLALDHGTGLYRSDDRGETWVTWSHDEPALRVPSSDHLFGLAISADGATAWAAIRGHGLLHRAL